MQKRYFIKTYGCQMNVYDSERMQDVLAAQAYLPAETMEEADVVILNTCHIREKAAEKVYSELGRIKRLKMQRQKAGKEFTVGVAGCVAQAEGEEVMRRAPVVDMVFGPQNFHRLPELLGNKQQRPVELDFVANDKFDTLPAPRNTGGRSAFVSVQEGCDKFCTFCVVPYTRGAEYSRPVKDIIEEVKQHLDHGVIEISLLGQNVNAYHGAAADGSEWSLAQLIEHLAEFDQIKRIRYTTSHPRDMHNDLYRVHGEIDKLMPYLYLPIQAGSDRVLHDMNRKHTAAEYIAMVEQLRSKRPDIAFSGDFIVGFPGETDEDFEATLRVVETVHYASAYSFKYSTRPGTPGATRSDQVPEEVKGERLARLQALLNKQQEQFNARMVGKTLPVLFEKAGKHANQWLGKSPYMQSVHVPAGRPLEGQMLDVHITQAGPNSLGGELV